MGYDDKAKHKAEEVAGSAKQKWGDLTDNESLEAEGTAQKAGARAKQAGDHLADAGRDARDALRD